MPSSPKTSTTSFSAGLRPDDACPECWGTGYKGWKTPHSYPIHEVEFCASCPKGPATQRYWQRHASALRHTTLERLFRNASIPARFADLTIGTLARLDDPAKREAVAACQSLIESGAIMQRGQGRNSLLLSGPFGVGKTGLLTATMAHFLEQGNSGLWIEFYDLVLAVQAGYSDGSSAQRMEAAREADWLLLDDVGDLERRSNGAIVAETDDRRKILYQILNHRHNNRLPTLITSNLNPGQFSQQFGARVTERVMESFAIVGIGGRNLRLANIDPALDVIGA